MASRSSPPKQPACGASGRADPGSAPGSKTDSAAFHLDVPGPLSHPLTPEPALPDLVRALRAAPLLAEETSISGGWIVPKKRGAWRLQPLVPGLVGPGCRLSLSQAAIRYPDSGERASGRIPFCWGFPPGPLSPDGATSSKVAADPHFKGDVESSPGAASQPLCAGAQTDDLLWDRVRAATWGSVKHNVLPELLREGALSRLIAVDPLSADPRPAFRRLARLPIRARMLGLR